MVVDAMQGDGGPRVLLVREAAAIARVSPATIRAAVRRGELVAVCVGRGTQRRHVRVTRAALLGWLGLSEASHGETIPITPGQAPSPAGGAARPARTVPAARRRIADETGGGALHRAPSSSRHRMTTTHEQP